MSVYLVVTTAFSIYNRGDTITNPAVIANLISSPDMNHFVAVGNSGTITLPNFLPSGFLALGSGSSTFTELSGAGYARVALTMGPMFFGFTSSTTAEVFTATGTWLAQTQFAVCDASGNVLFWWTNPSPVTLTNGQTITSAIGGTAVKLPDLIIPPVSASVIYAPGATIGTTPAGNAVVAQVALQIASGQVGKM